MASVFLSNRLGLEQLLIRFSICHPIDIKWESVKKQYFFIDFHTQFFPASTFPLQNNSA